MSSIHYCDKCTSELVILRAKKGIGWRWVFYCPYCKTEEN